MVNRQIDYSADAVEAARQAMLEVARVLGEYADSIVIVGGWVPELLLTATGVRHIGSNDVDLALNHRKLTEAGYRTIREHLLARGYTQHLDQPFVFLRTVNIQGRDIAHFPCGIDALADAFRPHLRNKLVQEGLAKISGKFSSPEHVGPRWVADFDELTDAEARAIRQRDAFERVAALLSELGSGPAE